MKEVFSFHVQPSFGASLHILKVEIGGDSQSSGLWLSLVVHLTTAQNYMLQVAHCLWFRGVCSEVHFRLAQLQCQSVALQRVQRVLICVKNGMKITIEGMNGG